MAETVLRVEVSDVTKKDPSSLGGSKPTDNSLLAGAIGGEIEDVFDEKPSTTDEGMSKLDKLKSGISTTTKVASAGIGTVAAVYNVYSENQRLGMELSGSTHAASVQARKASLASFGAQLAGAALINPIAAVGVLAMKAYQTSQTNRKEIFEIRKSQIQAQVLQRNLVKNVAERRF